MMKAILSVIYILLITTTTVKAQEALRKYTAEISRIETLTDEAQKSKERGKALAIFFDTRIVEVDKQTAINETVTKLKQLIDYDFRGAYSFLLKVKNVEDAKMFKQNYMSKNEQTYINVMATTTVTNSNNNTNADFSSDIPKNGYGIKGKWQLSSLVANTSNSTNGGSGKEKFEKDVSAERSKVTTTNDDGNTELAKGNEAEKAKNGPEAMRWYKLSAAKGNDKAMYNVGYMYYHSLGVAQNYTEAFNWFKQSADKGNERAMYNIGAMYYNGKGVAKNEAEAQVWFHKSADKGDEDAKKVLQQLALVKKDNGSEELKKGKDADVAQNYTDAMKWFRQSAGKGNAEAMYNIGLYYRFGLQGTTAIPSDMEAMKWFKQAADKGNVDAMNELGMMYFIGRGITKDNTEAYNWLKKASDKGHKSASTYLKLLAPPNESPKDLNTSTLKSFKNDDGKWGFKDGKNIIIIQPKYSEVKPFTEGMAAVCIIEGDEKKWGYIDLQGKQVIPFIYGDAIRFSEGLAAVRTLGKTWNAFYGFVDKSGTLVIPHEYPFVFDTAMYDGWVFVGGKAKVYKNDRIFFIDKAGKELK